MGNCSGKDPYASGPYGPEYTKNYRKFRPNEIHMLRIIYKDLSTRCESKTINKDTFRTFFPVAGLWGDQMFQRFDITLSQSVNFMEFIIGLGSSVKLELEDKIKYLFTIYDISNNNMITKQDLLMMLYNYPREDLEKITNDPIFLNKNGLNMSKVDFSCNNSMYAQSFYESRLNVQQQVFQNSKNSSEDLKSRQQSENLKDIVDQRNKQKLEEEQERLKRENEIAEEFQNEVVDNYNINKVSRDILQSRDKSNQRQDKQLTQPTSLINNQIKAKVESPREQKKKTLIQKSSSIEINKNITAAENSSHSINQQQAQTSTVPAKAANVTNVIKQYVNFVMNEQGVENLEYNHFKNFCQEHKQVLLIFSRTFRQNLWGEEKNQMNFKSIKLENEGFAYKLKKDVKNIKKVFLELRDSFIFVFLKQNTTVPHKIYCLEGLNIKKGDDNNSFNKYPIVITNKADTYRDKVFYFDTQEERKKWLDFLGEYHKDQFLELYTLGEKIGTGKFSIVFKGKEKSTEEEYAIKVITKNNLSQEEMYMLANETEMFRFLNHMGIIKVKEIFENRSHIYIIAELVKNGDLFDYVLNEEFLEEYEASLIMKQLFETVKYIHDCGVIHRDLKPENIMIIKGQDGKNLKQIKIIDFGFATIVKPGQEINDGCGTPNYIAPEILEGNYYNYKVDIFSLGCIMYFMLRGSLPFDSYIPDEIVENTQKGRYSLQDNHWRNVSPLAKDLIKRLLIVNPNERISIENCLQHPWIKERQSLKDYKFKNRKSEAQ